MGESETERDRDSKGLRAMLLLKSVVKTAESRNATVRTLYESKVLCHITYIVCPNSNAEGGGGPDVHVGVGGGGNPPVSPFNEYLSGASSL